MNGYENHCFSLKLLISVGHVNSLSLRSCRPFAMCLTKGAIAIFVVLLTFLSFSHVVIADVLHVGPGKEFAAPSIAAQFAVDGDVIEIDANGLYDGDVVVWTQNNLTLRGVSGRPHIRGAGAHAKGKGLWVIQGDNTTVENIEFSEAKVPDRNGAGIRLEGAGLTVRNCYFHHNENGILTGKNMLSDILIENSEFAWNGYGKGQTHNLYIGRVRSLTLRYNYIHHARIGHNVKTRALKNYILYNRIMDENDGNSSYVIDIPNGGYAYLIGNVLQQGPNAENWAIVSYGAEGFRGRENVFWMVNNTVVNDRSSGIFVKLRKATSAQIINNIFVGKGTLLKGPGRLSHNYGPGLPAEFVGRWRYDYRLIAGAQAVDAGLDRSALTRLNSNYDLFPRFEYVHVAGNRPRRISDSLDVGAYEYHQVKH